jgi:hypothetical protein
VRKILLSSVLALIPLTSYAQDWKDPTHYVDPSTIRNQRVIPSYTRGSPTTRVDTRSFPQTQYSGGGGSDLDSAITVSR